MKSFLILSLAATGLAAPVAQSGFGDFGSFGGFGGSGTKNDVTDGVCRPVTYIFARGTTETGNMGNTVGPALETALESVFGANKVATQGVQYPADFQGTFVSSVSPQSAEGAKTMASLAQKALKACPDTKVILAGYSQGAQQVHGALMNLQNGQVAAAITFGDPLQRSAFQNIDKSHTKIYCNEGDGVCDGVFAVSAAHLSYSTTSVKGAAQFAKDTIGSI